MSNRIRRQKSQQFVTISNEIMREKDISLKAKGLYALVMSLPDDWDFTLKGICAISKENYTAVNGAIKELMEAGYCKREQAKEGGRFCGYDYIFYDSKNGSPCLGFLNTENRNQYNNSNNSSLNNNINPTTNTINKTKNIKSVSDETLNTQEGLTFDDFYKVYPLKKSKQQAEKSWNRLSLKDKKAAYDRLPEYLSDCARCRRNIKHPSTYLNQRTWEDDFSSTGRIRFYDPIEGDSEQKKKFKAWMRNNFPEIEDTALPLSFEDYMQLVKGDHVEDVTNALTDIHNEIYKYRKSDIAQVVKSMIPNDEEE